MTDLTLLIPLYGRPQCTETQLEEFTKLSVPFSIYFADGSKEPQEYIVNKYKNKLDIHYSYSGFDKNINQYMNKMSLALCNISSPFCIMVDNDDSISTQGVYKGLEFLKNNDKYISYRGNVSKGLSNSSLYKDICMDQENPFDRISTAINVRNAAWHDIINTDILKLFFKLCYLSKLNDLQMVITLNVFWQAVFGKCHKSNKGAYYHHLPSSSLVQGRGIYKKYKDWHTDPEYKNSLDFIVSAVGCSLHRVYNLNLNACKEKISTILSNDLKKYNNNSPDIIYTDNYDPKILHELTCLKL